MYVCLCQGVSERKVRAVIAAGARTIEQIGQRCGAGTRCGGCWPLLDDLLAEIDGRTPAGASAGTRDRRDSLFRIGVA